MNNKECKRAIELLDIGAGNTGSVRRCLNRLGIESISVGKDRDISGTLPVIFPGVGSFGAVMRLLEASGQKERLVEVINDGVPYLGICVGMQVLLEGSEESPGVAGLGLIEGMVKKFDSGKVPQIGWNLVEPHVATENKKGSGYAYFVNSYYADPNNEAVISHRSQYYRNFASGIKKDNITAYQFHPERSGDYGESLMESWLDATN
ncbi:imidazole glycerol phosphate synthase subunit HisH [bacterium]|nr:imidazole glycerol phosphate synthase subunit HisH [bacterium]